MIRTSPASSEVRPSGRAEVCRQAVGTLRPPGQQDLVAAVPVECGMVDDLTPGFTSPQAGGWRQPCSTAPRPTRPCWWCLTRGWLHRGWWMPPTFELGRWPLTSIEPAWISSTPGARARTEAVVFISAKVDATTSAHRGLVAGDHRRFGTTTLAVAPPLRDATSVFSRLRCDPGQREWLRASAA